MYKKKLISICLVIFTAIVAVLLVTTFTAAAQIQSTNWSVTTISEMKHGANQYNSYTSISIDPTGEAHISYQGSSSYLQYATSENSWLPAVVHPYNSVARENSLAFDSQGHPYICYSYRDGNNENLMLAKKAGNVWSIETVDSSASTGLECSIALDSKNQVHVIHWQWSGSNLRYSTKISNTWSTQSIDTARWDRTSLEIDSNDNLHVAYDRNGQLYYASNISGAWSMQLVDPSCNSSDFSLACGPALALDSTDKVHILYSQGGNLKYATDVSGSWSIETAVSGANSGKYHDIVVDNSGQIHISYYNGLKTSLDYAYKTGTNWVTTTVEFERDTGRSNAIAVDADGYVHLSYRDQTGTLPSIEDLWANSETELFAVGEGGIAFYDSEDWTKYSSIPSIVYRGVWGFSATHVLAAGSGGTVVEFNGISWVTLNTGTPTNLYDIWASSPSNIFAVGDGGLILYSDGTDWTQMNSGTTNRLTSIWGRSATDVFAVGQGGVILHFDGISWNDMSPGTGTYFEGVWASSTTADVFAVGSSGSVWHFNGTLWTTMNSGVGVSLNAVWGNNPADIYAVGSGGTIIHYDGITWSRMTSGVTVSLNGVGGTPSLGAVAAGSGSDSGNVLRYNGSSWEKLIFARLKYATNRPNMAPVAVPDVYSGTEDTLVFIPSPGVLTNDMDLDGDLLTAVLDTDPNATFFILNPDGEFFYWPLSNFCGNDIFTYHANDGLASSSIVSVTINLACVNDAPVAVEDGYTLTEDNSLAIAAPGVLANDSDIEGDALSAVLNMSPTNATTFTFNSDGSFIYTPETDFCGSDTFTYNASDGQANSPTATVFLNTTCVNDSPIANTDNFTATEDSPLIVGTPGVLTNDNDIDGDSLTAVLDISPTQAISFNMNEDGSFQYIPTTNSCGTDSFSYHANDGVLSSTTVTVTLEVVCINDPPVAVGDTYTTTEDLALTVDAPGILANDTDVEGDSLTAILDIAPSQTLTFTFSSDGGFGLAPIVDFCGNDYFTYHASDGLDESGSATVAIIVTCVNDAPIAAADSFTMTEDTPLIVNAPGVLGNDNDVDGDELSAVLDSLPSQAITFTLNADGSFEYFPIPDYCGNDFFTYQATDGLANSVTVGVVISIGCANDAPIAANDHYSITQDAVLTVGSPGVLANDNDVDGDELSAVLNTSPIHALTFALDGDGSFTYQPESGFCGSDNFTYFASDGITNSTAASVTISISCPDQFTIFLPLLVYDVSGIQSTSVAPAYVSQNPGVTVTEDNSRNKHMKTDAAGKLGASFFTASQALYLITSAVIGYRRKRLMVDYQTSYDRFVPFLGFGLSFLGGEMSSKSQVLNLSLKLGFTILFLALLILPAATGAAPEMRPIAISGCEAIFFTDVPTYGSTENLKGRIECVDPDDYKVAVYIYYAGWYNKPYWAQPLTTILPNGTLTTDITTGGNGTSATKIAAFLWPNDGSEPPLMSGGTPLAEELFNTSPAYTHVERTARQLTFAGLTWHVKGTPYAEGPGPNRFSDLPQDVWVDANGRLHLTIHYRDGIWYSTEVFTTEPMNHGLYTYAVSSSVDNLDPNVVVGLFSWDSVAPMAASSREIDIEFSRWGDPNNPYNAQWVVAPYTQPGHLQPFDITGLGNTSLHRFLWLPSTVSFEAYQGLQPAPQTLWNSWNYNNSDIPPADDGNARINLWLLNGSPPTDGQEVEVIFSDFKFSRIAGPYSQFMPFASLAD